MNHLIVYSHPNPKSFNHAILTVYEEALKTRGHAVVVRDLYAMDFDPVLSARDLSMFQKGSAPDDIQEEQRHVSWAEVITFICPIWWGGYTSNLRGYIDRVFSRGFAYLETEKGLQGLFGGKRLVIINTMGAPFAVYDRIGMLKSMTQTNDECMSSFCGIQVAAHKYFGNVVNCPDSEREAMLSEVRSLAESFG